MTTDVKTGREAQLERYIFRSALEIFLANLVAPGGSGDLVAPFQEGESDRGLLSADEDSTDLNLAGDLFEQLWPDESGQSTAEWALANGRQSLQVAHIFSRLAEAGPFLREQADRFRQMADEELLSAQEYVAEGERS